MSYNSWTATPYIDNFGTTQYFKDVAGHYLLVPAILAGIWLVFGITFFVLRFFFHKCGYINDNITYTKRTRLIFVVLILMVTTIVITCCIIGIIASDKVTDGLNEFFDAILTNAYVLNDRATQVSDSVNSILDVMEYLYIDPPSISIAAARAALRNLVDSTEEFIDTATDWQQTIIEQYDTARVVINYVGYITILCLYILASVSAVLMIGYLSSPVLYLIFLPQVFLFIMAGAHIMAYNVLADTCINLDGFANQGERKGNFFYDEVCLPQDLNNTAFQYIYEVKNKTEAAYAIYGNTSSPDYNATIALVLELRLALIYPVVQRIDAIIDCVVFRQALGDTEESLCVTVYDSTYTLYVTQIVIGAFGFIGFYIIAKGVKRFTRPSNQTS
jgi:hypothetical protein